MKQTIENPRYGEGIFLIKKPPGMTSFDLIRYLKRELQITKIGHTGTLDKFAEGLVIILYGNYTRLCPVFLNQDKEYIARIELGTTTDTLDPEGTVISRGEIPSLGEIKAVLPQFLGEIKQVPPLYSAVHIDGQRAYQRARRGEQPVIKTRQVIIHNLEILSYQPPFLEIRVECSKGTYIRALARDLGRAAGSCGYLTALLRTRIGRLPLSLAVEPAQIRDQIDVSDPLKIMLGLDGIAMLTVKPAYRQLILTGALLKDEYFLEERIPPGRFLILDQERTILALVEKTDNRYQYAAVLVKNRDACAGIKLG